MRTPNRHVLFVFIVALASNAVDATEINFPAYPTLTVPQHVASLLRKIPVDQIQADAHSETIYVSGSLTLNLTTLPERTRGAVATELERVLSGQLRVAGSVLDSSRAQVVYLTAADQRDLPAAMPLDAENTSLAKMMSHAPAVPISSSSICNMYLGSAMGFELPR